MSKSYGNAIYLGESTDSLKSKIMSMLTDTNRKRLKDPGSPEHCNLYPYLPLLEPEGEFEEVREWCTTATKGCMECKKMLFERMEAFLEPIRARREELRNDPDRVMAILERGNRQAREEASNTLHRVRGLLNLNY
jgi:tryptophanyl-tRNA synthetase